MIFDVVFYGCDKSAVRICRSYQYYLGFDGLKSASLAIANDWTLCKRLSFAAWRAPAHIEMRIDVNVEGGGTEANSMRWHQRWVASVHEFNTFNSRTCHRTAISPFAQPSIVAVRKSANRPAAIASRMPTISTW